jgi:hypothetical protein
MIGLQKADLARGPGVQDLAAAYKMLDTFASVGATQFDLTHIDIDGEKRGFRPQQSVSQLKNSLPKLFPGAEARRNNIIVRPHSGKTQLIQLDDLDQAALSRVGEAAFLTLQTSPGNHQASIAVSGVDNVPMPRTLPVGFAKGQGPTQQPREQPVLLALRITNASTNQTSRP